MNMMKTRLWSANSLSVELKVNPRTLARALANVAADGKIAGRDAWFLTTAVQALREYEKGSSQLMGRRLSGPTGGAPDAALAELERLAGAVDAGMVRLRQASSEDRLKVLEGFGSLVGQLDRALTQSVTSSADAVRILRPYHDRMVGPIVREIVELLQT